MFMILPHSAEIQIRRIPWIVVAICCLCLLILYLQELRRDEIYPVIKEYCREIQDKNLEKDATDYLRTGMYTCISHLSYIHDLPDKSTYDATLYHYQDIYQHLDGSSYTKEELVEEARYAQEHYSRVVKQLPESLDEKLVYDGRFPNPFRMILSSLSHAGWWHLIGNLIFFLAFAPTLELVIGNSWRFILALTVISVSCSLFYSLSILFGAEPNVTLGLSGVVMGVIGMSAFMMPNVRIRTFIWFMFYARNYHIPAWALASWFIGWDIYDLSTRDWTSNINFTAHVAGGITGYFIARHYFRARRKEIQGELNDEVNYMIAKRQDSLGLVSSFRSKSQHHTNNARETAAKRDFSRRLDMIHQAINCGQDSLAINLFLEPFDDYMSYMGIYEEIYREMLKWPHSRAILCLSRLLINHYLQVRRYAMAVEIANAAFEISSNFVFADEQDRTLLCSVSRRFQINLTDKAYIQENDLTTVANTNIT